METYDNNDDKRSLFSIEKSDARATFDEEYPLGTTKLDCQVAGHPFDPKKNKNGMLRDKNGRVLKSCEKPILQEREIAFYEAIGKSKDPLYKELSQFTPEYFGTVESSYKNRPIKFIVLKDMTEGMKEPCVMDVKIGKRTWDPLAGPEKREADDRKYAASKIAYGFCIPGFQVYNIASGQLRRFNKDYMKKLDAEGVVDALRIFLNAESDIPPCRELIVSLLSHLWKILAFFRNQKKFRFYASSLLLTYDAQPLRARVRATSTREIHQCRIETRGKTFSSSCETGLSGRSTASVPTTPETAAKCLTSLVSDATSAILPKTNRVRAIDRLNRLKRSASLSGCDFANSSRIMRGSTRDTMTYGLSGSLGRGINDNFSPLCRTHSFTNNYDRDIMEMKEDYAALLEKLTGKSRKQQNWVRVSMIDFTHVFDAEDDSTDSNYLTGIQHLVNILETFLS